MADPSVSDLAKTVLCDPSLKADHMEFQLRILGHHSHTAPTAHHQPRSKKNNILPLWETCFCSTIRARWDNRVENVSKL